MGTKITLRLSEPVTEPRHQQYILGAALRDVGGSAVFFSNDAIYFNFNPFKFNPEGTAIEGVIPAAIPDKDITQFKKMTIGTMNAGFRGNTTRVYEPASDFPKVQVKAMDVENAPQVGR